MLPPGDVAANASDCLSEDEALLPRIVPTSFQKGSGSKATASGIFSGGALLRSTGDFAEAGAGCQSEIFADARRIYPATMTSVELEALNGRRPRKCAAKRRSLRAR